MQKYFKEEWHYIPDFRFKIENIENCTIKVNDLKVDMKMSQDFRFKGYIEYTIYIYHITIKFLQESMMKF
ncbi:TPA: hypothetical protein ACXNC6_002210 [Clostridioides difficile]